MGALEIMIHWILWPGILLFVLMVQPIPIIRGLTSKVILFFGSKIKIMNVSIFLFIGFCAFAVWAAELTEWYQKYGNDNRDVETVRVELLPMDFDKAGRHAKRWRLERNLYMGALTAVVYFALHVIGKDLKQCLSPVFIGWIGTSGFYKVKHIGVPFLYGFPEVLQ